MGLCTSKLGARLVKDHAADKRRKQRRKTSYLAKPQRTDSGNSNSTQGTRSLYESSNLYYDTPPPTEHYVAHSNADNDEILHSMESLCLNVAFELAKHVTQFPGLIVATEPSKSSGIVSGDGLKFDSAKYIEAFYTNGCKVHALSAILAKWLWDCIEDERIFTPEAVADLNVVAQLPYDQFDDSNHQKEAIYAARMVNFHGAGKPCSPGSPPFKNVQERFLAPIIKHFPTVTHKVLDGFAREAWRYAIKLRNQKGNIAFTWHPMAEVSMYVKRRKETLLEEVVYYDRESRKGYDSPGGALGFPHKPSGLIWFPEVTIYGPTTAYHRTTRVAVVYEAQSTDRHGTSNVDNYTTRLETQAARAKSRPI